MLESNRVARGFLPAFQRQDARLRVELQRRESVGSLSGDVVPTPNAASRVVKWDAGRHALRRDAGAAGEPVSFREALSGITGYNAHLTMTFKPSASHGNTAGVEGSERRRRRRRYTQLPARH